MAWVSHSFVMWVIDGDLLLHIGGRVLFLAGSSLWLGKNFTKFLPTINQTMRSGQICGWDSFVNFEQLTIQIKFTFVAGILGKICGSCRGS